MHQNLLLNIIPFTPPIKQKTFPFYKERKEGYAAIYIDTELIGLLDGKMTKLEQADTFWLYTDFKEPQEGAMLLDIDLTLHIELAKHYYRHIIFEYFKNGIAHIMHRNYIKEVEVLFLNEQFSSDEYNVYKQYTLKVQHQKATTGFELVVSHDRNTKVYKKSLAQLVGEPTDNYKWMNCDGVLHKWQYLPNECKLNLDKVYPIINNKMMPGGSITKDTTNPGNRYQKYYKTLSKFYNDYLDNDDFRSVIPLDKNGFITIDQNEVKQIRGDSNKLQFGKGIGLEPKTDLKRLGPAKPVPAPNNVKFFFIYQENDKSLCNEIKGHFLNGYKGHPNMQAFIHQPFSFDDDLNICLKKFDYPIENIWVNIKNRIQEPNTKYFALYISPVSKFDEDYEKRRIYYRIKEMLLTNQYHSQVIFKENVLSSSFNYFLPNIQIAILAKLGGVPWRLNREPNKELIVGIGAFYCSTKKTKFVGSASCFNNEGEIKGFTCFGSGDTISLAGSIREAVEKFIEQNNQPSRLIIHFYKVISKREMKPILDTLYNKLKLSIPVIIVTINKTANKEIIAFDAAYNQLMPYSGTYLKVGKREYLLFNNTRYHEHSVPTAKEYHFPVKIKFTSTHLQLLEDQNLIDLLLDQVYQFSRMYWKSVSQQNLPVTIKYPEMVAEIYPYFKYDQLPPFGEETLWFL